MKKSLTSLTALALTTVVAFSVGSTPTDASTKHFVAKTDKEKAWVKYVDKAIHDKKFEAYNDGMKAFGIDPDEYTYYAMSTLSKDYKGIDKKSAVRLRIAVMKTAVEDAVTGDIVPGIFLKNDNSEAFALYKTSETGENHIYWYKPDDNGDWKLEKKEDSKGEKLAKLKLKKLNEFTGEQ